MSKVNQEFNALKKKRIKLIKSGQDFLTVEQFKRSPNSYKKVINKVMIIICLLCIIAPILLSLLHKIFTDAYFTPDQYFEFYAECGKIIVGAILAFIIAIIATNNWQQRSISFTMIQELNSVEFHKIRNRLWFEMDKAIEEARDIEPMDGWFPYNDYYLHKIIAKEPPPSG